MPGRRRRSSRSTATSTTTRTRAAAPRKRAPAKPSKSAELPVAGPGERIWVLAVPFRAPAPGAVWHAGLQAHVWVGVGVVVTAVVGITVLGESASVPRLISLLLVVAGVAGLKYFH